MNISDQQQYVDELYKSLYKQKDQVEETKQKIQTEVCKLQAMCSRKGHMYSRHSDEDYHRPSYYYVCTICKHYTNQPPSVQ